MALPVTRAGNTRLVPGAAGVDRAATARAQSHRRAWPRATELVLPLVASSRLLDGCEIVLEQDPPSTSWTSTPERPRHSCRWLVAR